MTHSMIKFIWKLILESMYVLKKLNQWTCEGIFIDHPGLHEIQILHKDEKISTFDIEFTRGIKENNLGF